ncbi:O-antigen ligase family protein [uncultured Marivirga sp.]|uniref:O-antigen ligase family protein n=1 Tax=Marivirga harenae TaxID=2010992 RepID=UPI0030EFA442|tara:strand:- start:272424 stop:273650 length:1227 start_codon:yes stop_codon:yes gene_type:complete
MAIKRAITDLNLLFVLFFIFTIPFKTQLNSAVIIALVPINIYLILFNRPKFIWDNKRILLFSTIPLYCLLVFSLLISSNAELGFKYVVRISSFLIIPIAYLNLKFHQNLIGKLLFTFICSIIISIIIIYTYVFYDMSVTYRNISFLNSWWYSSYKLLSPLKIHTTYFGMYLLMSIGILIKYFLENKLNRFVFYVMVSVIYFVLIMNTSRMPILIGGLLLIYLGFMIFKIYKKDFIIFFIVFTGIVYYSLQSSYLSDRFSALFNQEYSMKDTEITDIGSVQSRVAVLESAFSVIKRSPLYGYGVGSDQKALNIQYEKNEYYWALNKSQNAHNQFLQTFLQIGIIGLSSFLVLLFNVLRKSFMIKLLPMCIFTLIIVFSSLSESILGLQKGIVFFATFANVFIIRDISEQ